MLKGTGRLWTLSTARHLGRTHLSYKRRFLNSHVVSVRSSSTIGEEHSRHFRTLGTPAVFVKPYTLLEDVPNPFVSLQSLDGSERRTWMKQLNEDEYDEAFNLFELTAKAGGNIGVGEIPSLEFFKTMMNKSVAVGSYNNDKILQDVIIIKPYHVVRSVSPIVCQMLIATRTHPVSQDHLRHLIRVGWELAGRQDCGGYSACVVEVFAYCLHHLKVLREEGFQVTCTVPHAGQLSGHKEYVMSYCLYKQLNAASSGFNSYNSYNSYKFVLQDLSLTQVISEDYETNFEPNLLTCPEYFPQNKTLGCGMKATVRHLQREELSQCYEAFSQAVNIGFGVNEFPTFEIFKRLRINNSYSFVVEESDSKKILGYYVIGSSRSTRCRTEKIVAGSMLVVPPQYRKMNIGSDIMSLFAYTAKCCGYRANLGTIAITNIPALKCFFGANKNTHNVVGVLPNGIYFTNSGWTDLLFRCCNIPQ